MKKLIIILLFVQIFTGAFALSSVLTVALGVAVLLFILGILNNGFSIKFDEPPFLLFFFFILIFGYLFVATGDKKTHHLLIWVVPALVYYYMPKRLIYKLFSLDVIKNKLLSVATIATLTACCYALLEFFMVNFLGNDMSFIPRGMVAEGYTPLALDSIRARSFMEESGQFALYWELFAPLSLYWIKKNVKRELIKSLFYLIMVSALIVSFSAVGFVCLVLWAIAIIFHKMIEAKRVSSMITILLVSAFFLFLLFLIIPEFFDTLNIIISGKLDPDSSSHADRADRFDALKHLYGLAVLTGYGPHAAGTLNVDSFVSFYLGVLMNTGILGLMCFFLFMLQQFKYVRKLRDKELRFAFLMSLWFSSMHWMFVDNIYVPWFWILLSLLGAIHFKERDEMKRIKAERMTNNNLNANKVDDYDKTIIDRI